LGSAELIKKHLLGEVYEDRNDLLPLLDKILKRHQDYVDHISGFLASYPATFRDQEERIARLILHGDVSATNE
jgi:hypothetical protein